MGNKVFLLTIGDGIDGDEWSVLSIHRTKEGAELAEKEYEAPRERRDGSTYNFNAQVEEWDVKE